MPNKRYPEEQRELMAREEQPQQGSEGRPAWQRRTRGEHRWPTVLAVVVAIGLQWTLPARLIVGPRWVLPAVAALLLVAVGLINPGRIDRYSRMQRSIALLLVAVVSVATALSAARLAERILVGSIGGDATELIWGGAVLYATNIIVFSLWYWEFDRGGPADRAMGLHLHPDLLFPQMASPQLASLNWEPTYVDYLYLAFTNATAFSPTDVMPLKRWAKMAMLVQSAISFLLVILVIARAINILH
ncbi:MAG: hypothetical protein ACREP9_15830 [Candidatus Dormibacteraceae bacterium]